MSIINRELVAAKMSCCELNGGARVELKPSDLAIRWISVAIARVLESIASSQNELACAGVAERRS